MGSLVLVEPVKEYGSQVMEYRKAFLACGDSLDGCGGLENTATYDEWLDFENRLRKQYGEGYVPSTVYLAVRKDDNKVVGIIDLRHWLSEFLLNYGGHIGYSVHPEERRKGYASEMLALMIENCRERGLDRVLLTCNKENIASARTIIKNGGMLENELEKKQENGKTEIIQRYWITLSGDEEK